MPSQDEASEKEMVVEASDKAADIRLHDIWVLEKIGDKSYKAADFANGLPQLEIFVRDRKISGHDGCNMLMGSFETWSDTLVFGAIATTMMACEKMKASDDFRAQLNQQTFNFMIKSNRLILNTENGQSLIFKKID
jgi:heat shock protein HslJ